MYMMIMQTMTISMYGIMPEKIWLSVTCGGACDRGEALLAERRTHEGDIESLHGADSSGDGA